MERSNEEKRLPLFDRTALYIKPLTERRHGLDVSIIKPIDETKTLNMTKEIETIARYLIKSKKEKAAIIWMVGAHVIRSGVQNYLIDLMERGYISCIATNGAGSIHDFEFALIGATTESVTQYIKEGQFGLWKETGQLNDIINQAYTKNKVIGMGEAIGEYIENSPLPYKPISILAAAYRLQIPVTVHVGIGYDIIHEHPNCDGAATGALSYNDFLKFVSVVQNLENGVVMNFGSAVMGPEVFLKALSMARNVAHQQDKEIRHFTTLVCDLVRLPENIKEELSRDDAAYYFRPWKTMLIRTVAEGGESFYIRGKHAQAISSLWANINKLESKIGKSGGTFSIG
ncbi:hypothetical protein KKB84_02580 [bacterium]|nr:hypothetical protein [bacterium]